MKIYPSKHRLYSRKQIVPGTVPLSYVYNDEKNRDITIRIEDEFGAPYVKTRILPHQLFDSDEIFLFDQSDTPVANPSSYLQRIGARWRLLPERVAEFVPKTFDFAATIQYDDLYSKELTYKIRLGFASLEQEVQNRLFALFQNTEQARQYPANIIFNNGETMPSAFLNLREADCDLLFFTKTGLEQRARENDRDLKDEIETLVAQHLNLWIVDDTFEESFFNLSPEEEYGYFRLEYNDIYTVANGTLTDYKDGDNFIRIRPGAQWDKLDYDTYQEVPFFREGTPLQILHKNGDGYIILSHTHFLSKINQSDSEKAQVRLLFETLLYVYLHSYHTCIRKQIFITDEIVDYYINTSQRYTLSHPRLNLNRLLQDDGNNPKINYRIDRVTTEIPETETGNYTVQYVGTNRFQDLIFKKIAEQTKDPAKGNNVLVYTADKTILVCVPDKIALSVIESGVTIRIVDEYTIAVAPVLSTKHRIFTTEESFVTLDTIGTFVLYYNRAAYYNHAIAPFAVITKSAYAGFAEQKDLVKIAEIEIAVNMDIEYKDIRIPGGGEASMVPNYEMIDTGNLYGRPLRYGGPMIIELPERFQPMKKEIKAEVEKHIASGDYPIILYKD